MAKDSRSTFPIIDDNGCPVDPTIFPRYLVNQIKTKLEAIYSLLLDLLLKEQLYKVFMKHLDSQSHMVLYSSAMSNTVLDLVNL